MEVWQLISIIVGFVVLVFQAGAQWGKFSSMKERIERIENQQKEDREFLHKKIEEYNNDAVEFYKNLKGG
jgi:hypothetical protein